MTLVSLGCKQIEFSGSRPRPIPLRDAVDNCPDVISLQFVWNLETNFDILRSIWQMKPSKEQENNSVPSEFHT